MLLNDTQKKTYMQNAFRNVSMLNTVHQRELERASMEGRQAFFTYNQYLVVLRGVASTFDEAVAGRRSSSINKVRTKDRRSTSVHMAEMESGEESGAADSSAETEIMEYTINMMRRRMKGSSMSKDTWESLTPEGKKTWDLMSDADKKSILQHAVERAEKEGITANTVDFEELEEGGALEDNGTETEASEEGVDVNNVNTDAKKLAHPGDPRRMMSGKGKGGKKKIAGFTVTFSKPEEMSEEGHGHSEILDMGHIDDVLEEYWNRDGGSDDESDFHQGG
jgi:hypothetical protein